MNECNAFEEVDLETACILTMEQAVFYFAIIVIYDY